MERVIVNTYQIGMVLKNGVFEKMLHEGKYWIWNRDVRVFDKANSFIAPIDLNILLQNNEFVESVTVVDVANTEIILKYENNILKEILTEGKYAYWKGLIDYKFVKADIGKIDITEDIDRATLQSKLLAAYIKTVTIENYEKAVLLVDGKYVKVLEAGTYIWWKNNIAIYVGKVDTRLQQMEINGQEILTKDKAALRINAFAQYKVVNIEQALLNNKDYDKQLYVILQLALREFVGGYSFDELLEKKDSIAASVIANIKDKAEALGIEVASIGIRDIVLPGDIKEIMNQVLVAEKKAQANIIMRREETASTRSLLNTAKLMEENAMLWKLKEMEYVEKIADKISNISVNGNGDLVGQLKQIFVSK
jgi:hypothetical protein